MAGLVLAGVGPGGPGACDADESLGHPGYVILAGAADSAAGYRWRDGPGPDQRSLVWTHGVLTVPRDFACERFGAHDLAVPVSAQLGGAGGGGGLVFADGRYVLEQPLHLGDGRVSMYFAAGELEILAERIRYVPPTSAADRREPRAGLLFLAGMILLVAVMLRLARRRTGAAGP